MGNDRADKRRATEWIERSCAAWSDPLTPREISLWLNANTGFMFGERVVRDLCDSLVFRGVLLKDQDSFYPKRKKAEVSQ